MTESKPFTTTAMNQTGFIDMRQQIAALVCTAPVPADQLGKLPADLAPNRKLGTLHLSQGMKAAVPKLPA